MIPLLVKFPTRERPERFAAALDLLIAGCWHPDRVHFLFTLDRNDPAALTNERIIQLRCWNVVPCSVVIGASASKIDAVNRDIPGFEYDWRTILVASDDMLARDAWDVWAHDAMRHYYPDGDGCVWFSDGHQHHICTIPCMGRTYYDRFGYIYNPIYRSVFADDEQTHQATAMGRMTRLDHVLMEHDHPAWNNAIRPDELYRRNESSATWAMDERTYHIRRKAGFP